MSTLDQYEVLEQLGTGSFGTVSKLRRKADNRILVWKEINFGKMSEKEKTQLVSEVNILRELRNPFIVRYHDRIVDKPRTRLYIIMEHCAGGDLGRLIKRHQRERVQVEEKFIWKIFAQAVLALKDCHRRQENGETKPILHRDLKPANILLDADQNIKMGDFGLAKELSSQSKLATTNVGTPFYMAPEIINEKDYDEKSDIWSLGCLLYELAALKPPFEATNAYSLAVKINAGKISRIPSRYSDALFDAIKVMIQLDPRKRPRVEDLESLPSLQPAMNAAKAIANDYKSQQTYGTKVRELKSKEDSLAAKEEQLKQYEQQLKEKETKLFQWEQQLKQLASQLNMQQQQQQQAMFAAGPSSKENTNNSIATTSSTSSKEDNSNNTNHNNNNDMMLPNPILPSTTINNSNVPVAYNTRRRLSLERAQQQQLQQQQQQYDMMVDEDIPLPDDSTMPFISVTTDLSSNVNTNIQPNTTGVVLMPPPAPRPSSAGATGMMNGIAGVRRGPIPIPSAKPSSTTINTTAGPGFQIHCDFNGIGGNNGAGPSSGNPYLMPDSASNKENVFPTTTHSSKANVGIGANGFRFNNVNIQKPIAPSGGFSGKEGGIRRYHTNEILSENNNIMNTVAGGGDISPFKRVRNF